MVEKPVGDTPIEIKKNKEGGKSIYLFLHAPLLHAGTTDCWASSAQAKEVTDD